MEQENKELKEEIDYLNKSRDAWELVAVVGQSRYEKHQQIIRDLRAENNALAQEIEALTDEMASGTEEMEIANSALREAMRTINQLRATVGELTRSVEGYPDQSSN